MSFNLMTGNCIDLMRDMPDNSVDSIVTDPPYELGFMGKKWDSTGIAYNVFMWAECLRVLKPGGHLLAFSGSRTYHRMTVAIEDAGFEVRDQIMWVYGSGFPKSLDVSKAIDKSAGAEREKVKPRSVINHQRGIGNRRPYMDDPDHMTDSDQPATAAAAAWQGWGTALKPAHEPICVARKPLIGTVAENVLAHGTGALNIDGCRVDANGDPQLAAKYASVQNAGKRENSVYGADNRDRAGAAPHNAGRWPANLIHDGSEEVLQAFPNAPGQQGDLKETGRPRPSSGRFGDMAPPRAHSARIETDSSAARFFYCAKASKKDRNHGCDEVMTWENADLSRLTDALNELRRVTSGGMTLLTDDTEWNTSSFGSNKTAQFLRAIKCITETVSKTTTESKTSNCSPHLSTSESIRAAIEIAKANGSSLAELAEFISQSTPAITSDEMESALHAVRVALRALSETSKHAKRGNVHSTVKPTDLMRYLCRLVTPPGGTVLDPFMGSGSTGKAAMLEGFKFIGMEMNEEYMHIAKSRLSFQLEQQ